MASWLVEYVDIDVANQTLNVRIRDAEGKLHKDRALPWDCYIGKRILTTLFADYMDNAKPKKLKKTKSSKAKQEPTEGTLMHEEFASQFAHTLPLID